MIDTSGCRQLALPVVSLLESSLLPSLASEQENKTVVFCWQLQEKQKAGEKLTPSPPYLPHRGRSGAGRAQQGEAGIWGVMAGLGGDNRKQEPAVSLPSANTHRLNLQLNFCPWVTSAIRTQVKRLQGDRKWNFIEWKRKWKNSFVCLTPCGLYSHCDPIMESREKK